MHFRSQLSGQRAAMICYFVSIKFIHISIIHAQFTTNEGSIVLLRAPLSGECGSVFALSGNCLDCRVSSLQSATDTSRGFTTQEKVACLAQSPKIPCCSGNLRASRSSTLYAQRHSGGGRGIGFGPVGVIVGEVPPSSRPGCRPLIY